jgi:hypothetical protein
VSFDSFPHGILWRFLAHFGRLFLHFPAVRGLGFGAFSCDEQAEEEILEVLCE